MMSTAIISGRLTKAFVQDANGQWATLSYDAPDSPPVPCDEKSLSLELRDCHDGYSFEGELDAIRVALADAVDLTEAVDLTLWLLDPTLSEETRMVVAEELDELLAYEDVRDAWGNIFWAKPLPASVNFRTTVAIAAKVRAKHVIRKLIALHKQQPAINTVRKALEQVRSQRDLDASVSRALEGWCVRVGLHQSWVEGYCNGTASLASYLACWSTNEEGSQLVPDWAGFCQDWHVLLLASMERDAADRRSKLRLFQPERVRY